VTAAVRVGDVRSAVVCEEVTRTQIVQFAGASGDLSVLHTDEPAAVATGRPSVMAHGMMTMALAAHVVQDWFGAPAVRSLEVRFTAPVWPGDRLTCTATVTGVPPARGEAVAEVSLRLVNAADEVVLTGTAVVAVAEAVGVADGAGP
jgi:acyl dehydratase